MDHVIILLAFTCIRYSVYSDSSGCNPTQDGKTPLMTASANGDDEIVRMLIEAKAQVNTQDKVYVPLLPPENTLLDHLLLYVLGELTVFLSTEWHDCSSLCGSNG